MNVKKIIEKLANPKLLIVFGILAIIGVAAYAITLNMISSAQTEISNLKNVELSVDENTNKLNAATYDEVKKLNTTVEKLKSELNSMLNPQQELTEVVEKFMIARYNYDGKPEDNTEKILNDVSDYITDDFYGSLYQALSTSYKGGNMADKSESNNDGMTCEVESVYQDGRNKNSYSINETMYVYAKYKANDAEMIQRYALKNINGKWLINEENIMGIKK